ncbi:hypothetical protein CEXT_616741 [Caerostris extrusa]|uniref:Uncharacterized protein n=1 Tax=Caerostris extrusa TaxID=172846 RepID=A0AAV4T147_CAEEX|nr:hypothetical protein CEXT_616741 [Caerostris extrusa]
MKTFSIEVHHINNRSNEAKLTCQKKNAERTHRFTNSAYEYFKPGIPTICSVAEREPFVPPPPPHYLKLFLPYTVFQFPSDGRFD